MGLKFCQSMMFAPPDQWVTLTRVAEEAGFDEVALSDHVFYPAKLESKYPYTETGAPSFTPDTPWPDVWVMMGALAAVTERIRFVTNVYVLPARNPFVVAKAVATASFLSGGRVSLGVGAGWMREEFEQLGQPFEGRGARMEEMFEVLRKLWAGGMVEHHGAHFDFPALEMSPVPPAPVPILVGGHSDIALRRAGRLADGWIGIYYDVPGLADVIGRLEAERVKAGRADAPFEVVASPMVVPTADNCRRLEDAGLTTILTSAWLMDGLNNASLQDNVDALRRFGERFIEPLRR
jgi:probable F420-dependent oxidoreductase